MNFLGITYPLTASNEEKFYLDLNNVDTTEIKSLILHIMLTPKKQRYRMPSFGTDLLKFIFEPNDRLTIDDIKISLETTLSYYIPGISVDNLIIGESERDVRSVYLRVDYTVTQGVFQSSDFVEINL